MKLSARLEQAGGKYDQAISKLGLALERPPRIAHVAFADGKSFIRVTASTTKMYNGQPKDRRHTP
jgi:hypothetical protein